MKKLIVLVAVLALVAFTSSVMAQQTPAQKPAATAPTAPEKAKPAKVQKFFGAVSSIDATAKTVVVKSKKSEKTFTVGDTTKITRGGKEMALADLKEKMNVSVSYNMEADKAMATAIKISVPKTSAKAAPKKTEEKPAEAPAK
jgi:hypothetical protein